MTQDYSEKRNFYRMNLDCGAEYSINGSGNRKTGIVSDLSGDGISIIVDQAVEPGTEVRVCIQPENQVTPPLDITMQVVRCEQKDTDSYLLAGSITQR